MSENAECEKGVKAYKEGDYANALLEFRQLADKGYASAQNDLGVMYAKGTGVPQDNVRARMWFNIAASSGKVYAREIGADARKMRDEVEKNMSSAQITMAEQLARECIEKNYKGCY